MISIQKLLPFIALIVAFSSGYYVRELQQNKAALEQERTERKIINQKIEVSYSNAGALEQDLLQVKQHEQNIISTATQVTKMDRNKSDCNCFDDDFIKLFNNQNRVYERILSGKYDTALPDNTAKP